MSLINSTAIPSGASAYELEQSLRFEGLGSASRLSKTPAGNGNRRLWTQSFWLKRSSISTRDMLQGAYTNDNLTYALSFSTDGYISWYDYNSGYNYQLITNQVFRDPSAWYNIVLVLDTAQGTASNRCKMYVNGTQITSFSTANYPSQNFDGLWNTGGVIHALGTEGSNVRLEYDGYMSETHFIDGTALTPSSFGETGDYGEWKPKKYSGTYGTNGFYLPYKQDYTVEGFSTVTWKGNSTNNRYLGGVGFNSDLIWTKARNAGYSPSLYDSVRGYGSIHNLVTASTEAENGGNQVYGGIASSSADGFTTFVGSDGGNPYANHNEDGKTYVAWNWDMSNPASNVGNTAIQFDNSDDSIDFELGTALGTGNFTIEYWTYIDSLQNYDTLFSTTRGSTGFNVGTDADGKAVWYRGSRLLESASGTYVVGNWYHTAYVRNGTTLKVYVNGVEKDSTTDSNNYSELTSSIGSLDSGGEFGGIKLDAFRISNVARYTSNNFESPLARFTSDSNTLCLINSPTNVGGTIVDSSSANLSLSLTGTSVDASSVGKPAYPNTDGSITSLVRANTAYGQSVVSYTGTGSAGATVGHGLSSAPELIIVKGRNRVEDWGVGHTSLGWTKFIRLNTTAAAATATSLWNDTAPSNTLVTLGDSGIANNSSSTTMIMYCFHSVTGYSKFGSYSGSGNANNSVTGLGFSPAWIMIKRTDAADQWLIVDNTRTPSGDTEGDNLYAESSAAEGGGNSTAIQFDSNGFTVKGTDTMINASGGTYIYMAFADKREYAYWLDQSGNNNDWTSNNLTESDIMVDSPTNNFCTMNPLFRGAANTGDSDSAHTLSEGNLKMRAAGNKMLGTTIIPTSGKWYAEFYVNAQSTYGPVFGWVNNEYTYTDLSTRAGLWKVYSRGAGDQLILYPETASSVTLASAALHNGDIIQFAWDCASGKAWIGRNNTWYNASLGTTGNPATGANPTITTTVAKITNDFTPYIASSDDNSTVTLNFGQDSSFAGNKTAQGNQDGNDIGDFHYTPPTGFLALCTSNLPAVAVVPSEHFAVQTRTGFGSSGGSLTTNFAVDFLWEKQRNYSSDHNLWDAVRGRPLYLSSNTTDVDRSGTWLTSFNSNGVTFGSNDYDSGTNLVDWMWKANGSGSSNTDGSINTTKTSANVDAGFSIMTYTGTGSNATIGHGLSKTPEMWVVKPRTNVSDNQWFVCHKGLASDYATDFIHFDSTGAVQDNALMWNDTPPTSTVINLGSKPGTNGSGGSFVAYAWHSVDGYSAVGSYKGNGVNLNGPFVYTGFRPAYVMIKRTDSADPWVIFDSAREPENEDDGQDLSLKANDTAVEAAYGNIDFLSNGFKVMINAGYMNNNNSHYIYLAFAETPFKYSNAR